MFVEEFTYRRILCRDDERHPYAGAPKLPRQRRQPAHHAVLDVTPKNPATHQQSVDCECPVFLAMCGDEEARQSIVAELVLHVHDPAVDSVFLQKTQQLLLGAHALAQVELIRSRGQLRRPRQGVWTDTLERDLDAQAADERGQVIEGAPMRLAPMLDAIELRAS